MSMGYIRKTYGVPVKQGIRVTLDFDGQKGVITSADGAYVRVKLDGEKRSVRVHPEELNYGT